MPGIFVYIARICIYIVVPLFGLNFVAKVAWKVVSRE